MAITEASDMGFTSALAVNGATIGIGLGLAQALALRAPVLVAAALVASSAIGWAATFPWLWPAIWLFPDPSGPGQQIAFQAIQGAFTGLVVGILQAQVLRPWSQSRGRYIVAYLVGAVLARTVSALLNAAGVYAFLVDRLQFQYARVVFASVISGALIGIVTGFVVSARRAGPRDDATRDSVSAPA